MFDRLVEDFCQFDDFCQAFSPHWQARLLREEAQPAKKRGPQAGLADSEIMTILVLYHSSNFRHFRAFYEGVVLTLLRSAFPKAPCYARFIALIHHVWVPLTVFLLTRMGRRTGIYYIDSTPLPVCHPRRIHRHKVFLITHHPQPRVPCQAPVNPRFEHVVHALGRWLPVETRAGIEATDQANSLRKAPTH